MAVDVLDPGNGYTIDDGVYLLRDTSIAEAAKQEGATEFCGIPLSQFGFCIAVCRSRSGTASGLVAIRSVHGFVR